MLFSLKGKVAIVTGAGSRRGIGRSIALALAEQGADVIVCDVNLEGAKETSAEVVQEKGVRSEAYQVNVIDQSEIKACVEAVISKYGRIDILVNNAGITQPKKVLDITEEEWDRILAVNLKGTFLFSKRGGGVFGGAHYSAAKAGILAFSKAFAREVSPLGITVNSIAPGLAATDIRGGLEDEETQAKMTSDIPCRRMAKPEEIAAAVCFLASDEAAYITGEEIDINGGSHMD